MQTFLPYKSFPQSAKVLDNKRLGKQRVETLQILQTLYTGSRWINHPAVLMWKDCELSLITYGISICNEWLNRGFKDTCLRKILSFIDIFSNSKIPFWLGDEKFHTSHQSNLKRKFPEHYNKYFYNIPNNLPYFWPIRKNTN